MQFLRTFCGVFVLLFTSLLFASMFFTSMASAAQIAYIYGDVSEFGVVPSGNAQPYDQMRLNDTDPRGLSDFRNMVVSQGHTINEFYDQQTVFNSTFLDGLDVLILGLHQRILSAAERNALDLWIRDGGGLFTYSDSASGGCFCEVGAQNPVGQTVTNQIISQYGMQVTVDQAHGIRAFRSGPQPDNPLMVGRPELEGEGVSPIAVSIDPTIEVLIPYSDASENFVRGNDALPHPENISINNPVYAALALKTLEAGHIMVMFDRQPMWNSGPGSSINQRDNLEILRRAMNFLAQRPAPNPPIPPNPPTSNNIGFLAGILELLSN